MIFLERRNLQYYYYSDSLQEIKAVESSLTFVVQGAKYSELYQQNRWDGKKRLFDRRNRSFYFGLLSLVRKKIEKKGFEFKIVNQNENLSLFPVLESEIILKTDRDYQIEGIKRFFDVREGILKIFTRLGKTFVSAEIIANLLIKYPEFNVLFIVDTTDLIIQSKRDIKKYLGLAESRFGLIQAQEFKTSNINFATIQTLDSIFNRKVEKKRGMTYEEFMGLKKLHRNKARETLKFLEKVNLLIVDECHVYGSDARTSILKKIKNTSYRLYLSASPFKKDTLFGNLNVQSTGGDIFFEVTEKQGTKSGYLAKSKVILLLVDHSRNKNITQADYRTLVNKVIVNNKSRNSILVNIVEILRKLKLKSLVLFSYKDHARIISNITTDVFITGSTDVKVRQNVKKDFLRGKGKILYATNIFNKGVTLPECEVLVNAAGGKEETLIIQKKGRTLGVTENKKKALIIDFIDNYDYFNEHSFNRISAYQATTGKKNIIVLDTESEDFYNDFREFVQSWFNI